MLRHLHSDRDDIDLLVTLSNYVAIAIENSRLYSSLQRKASEYERLKEFSENIVESINVGILAADEEHTNPETARYLNRLSDLLFILAREANPDGDELWEPGAHSGAHRQRGG